MAVQSTKKVGLKVNGLANCYSTAYMEPSSALQSQKWQLIGM